MKRKNLVYHEQKCVFSTRTLNILGRVVCNGEINPDPERLKPLTELSPPKDSKVQKRVLGLFSYYSEWIKYFSQKIKPLAQNYGAPCVKLRNIKFCIIVLVNFG